MLISFKENRIFYVKLSHTTQYKAKKRNYKRLQ